MPYTVSSSFDRFYENINLGGDHRDVANARRDDIVAKLSESFDIVEAFSTGSIPKYTALKDTADLDVMIALHFTKHIQGRSPTAVLQSVRSALAEWRTGARRNGQAVTLYYKTWPNVDVVPVSRVAASDGTITHYEVPDSNTDQWIASKPKGLARDIEANAATSGANFRRLIKFMKHWNRVHGDYLMSYHVEVLALKCLSGNLDDTPWQMFQFFEKAHALLGTYVWHDTGIADNYLSWVDRQEVLKRVDTAITQSRDAWYLTYGNNSDHERAIQIWRRVFGDKFPAYG
jgi:hypothetical protein